MLNSTEQKEFGQALLSQLMEAGYKQCEIYISMASITSLEVNNGRNPISQYSGESGYQVRVIESGLLKTAASNDFSEAGFRDLCRLLKFGGIAVPANFSFTAEQIEIPDHQSFDHSILEVSLAEKWDLLKQLIERTNEQNFHIKQIPMAQYRQLLETVTYLNHNNICLSFASSGIQLLVNAIARKGDRVGHGVGISLASHYNQLSIDEAAEMAAENARLKLFEQKLEKTTWSVLLRPYAASLLVYLAWLMVNGSIGSGDDPTSLNFANDFDILDNPNIPKAPGSTPFDCEGTITAQRHIIKNGKFQSLLRDRLDGAMNKLESTGSARLMGISGARYKSVSNLYLASRDLLLELPDEDFLEIHLLEIPADFSLSDTHLKLTGAGFLHSKDEIEPCSNIQLLLPMDCFPGCLPSIGYDLKFFPFGNTGIFGSPSIILEGIEVQTGPTIG